MTSKKLEALQKGLKTLTDHVKMKKEVLQAQLAKKKSISAEDEHWLDFDTNLVDEHVVFIYLVSCGEASP